jgi:hypothetical protein
MEQVHRIAEVIRRTLEKKQYCFAAFLDITQVFDKVSHQELLFKIRKTFPHAAEPQESVLRPVRGKGSVEPLPR